MAKVPNDDLFEGTTMSFGEHLEELRTSLFRALIGIVVGFLIGMFVARYVVEFIQSPLKNALKGYYKTKAEEELTKEYGGRLPFEIKRLMDVMEVVPEDLTIDPGKLVAALRAADPSVDIEFKPHRFSEEDVIKEQFGGLCEKLKGGSRDAGSPGSAMWRLMSSDQQALVDDLAGKQSFNRKQRQQVVDLLNLLADNRKLHASAEFKSEKGADETTVEALRKSLEKKFNADDSRRLNKMLITGAFPKTLRPPQLMVVDLRTWKPAEVTIQALGAQEVFMIWLKASFVVGMLIASPYVFWQIWQFVAAGLYPHEKRYVYLYLPFSLLLFLAGASLAFFFVFEPVLNFLFSFNHRMNIDPDPRISEWLGFVLFLPIGFGIAFQLPLVMLFLNRIGVFTIETYLQKWRIAILVIFVISMLLTPADPISMLLMAIPLTFLYFLGVALCKWMPRGRNPFAEGYEP